MASGSDGRTDTLPTSCVLPDGAVALLRAALPDDAARLERLFYRLSPESISSYFFLPVPRQPHWAARLSELARTDGHDHYALVALVGGEIVGVARYDRGAAPEEAEFALLIEDAWQQRGLGKRLLARLVKEARLLDLLIGSLILIVATPVHQSRLARICVPSEIVSIVFLLFFFGRRLRLRVWSSPASARPFPWISPPPGGRPPPRRFPGMAALRLTA